MEREQIIQNQSISKDSSHLYRQGKQIHINDTQNQVQSHSDQSSSSYTHQEQQQQDQVQEDKNQKDQSHSKYEQKQTTPNQLKKYQIILSKLYHQNEILKTDYSLLKTKINILKDKQSQKEKQKLSKLQQINSSHQKQKQLKFQLKNLKQQLKQKTLTLNLMQSQTSTSLSTKNIMKSAKQELNKLNEIKKQIEKLQNIKNDELLIHRKLKKQLSVYNKTSTKKEEEILILSEENHNLKSQIFLTKQLLANLEYSIMNVHQYNFMLKERKSLKDKSLSKNKELRVKTAIQQLQNSRKQVGKQLQKVKLSQLVKEKLNQIQNSKNDQTQQKLEKKKPLLSYRSYQRAKTEMSSIQNKQTKKQARQFSVRNQVTRKIVSNQEYQQLVNRNKFFQNKNDLSQIQRLRKSSFKLKIPSSRIGQYVEKEGLENRRLQPQLSVKNKKDSLRQIKNKKKMYTQGSQVNQLHLVNNLKKSLQESKNSLKESKYLQQGSKKQVQQLTLDQLLIKSKELMQKISKLSETKQIIKIRDNEKIVEQQNQSDGRQFSNGNNLRQKILFHKSLVQNLEKISEQYNQLKEQKEKLNKQFKQKEIQFKQSQQLKQEKQLQQDNNNLSRQKPQKGKEIDLERKENLQQNTNQQESSQRIKQLKFAYEDVTVQTNPFLSYLLSFRNSPQYKQPCFGKQLDQYHQDSIGQFVCQEYCDFDHRFYLNFTLNQQQNQQPNQIIKLQINRLIIYHSDKAIHGLKPQYAFLSNQNKRKNIMSQPEEQVQKQQYLEQINHEISLANPHIQKMLQNKRITSSVISLSSSDHVKRIKLLYHQQTKIILKLQFISKLGLKYEYGNKNVSFPTVFKPNFNITHNLTQKKSKTLKKSQGQSKQQTEIKFYEFDISPKQYPSYLYGNYSIIKGKPYLSSLGCVIFEQ